MVSEFIEEIQVKLQRSIVIQKEYILYYRREGAEDAEDKSKEIFMYDIGSETVSRLRGELSNTFVEVAESNAKSQELDGLTDAEAAASALRPVRVPPPPGFPQVRSRLTPYSNFPCHRMCICFL